MLWKNHPSIRGTGNLSKPNRAEHYSNPPSNPGLRGFMLNKKPGNRGHDEGVTTGTSYSIARKGEPMR